MILQLCNFLLHHVTVVIVLVDSSRRMAYLNHGDDDHHDEQIDGDGDLQMNMGYTKSYLCLCRSYYVLLSRAIMFLSTYAVVK